MPPETDRLRDKLDMPAIELIETLTKAMRDAAGTEGQAVINLSIARLVINMAPSPSASAPRGSEGCQGGPPR